MKTTWKNEYPLFEPDYSPIEMFELGIMGGNYFDPEVGNWIEFTPAEFSQELRNLLDEKMYASGSYDKKVNFFGVKSGLSYAQWVENGWIKSQDPFGWINWYINFYYGRRSSDDLRQIKRWISFKPRHIATLLRTGKDCDLSHGLKTRQNLLHWAIDSKKLV
jgi:hypothetical protein